MTRDDERSSLTVSLSDDAIDPPDPARFEKGVRPIVRTSLAEALLLNVAAWFVFACYLPGFAGSPREAEWFGWAPAAARPRLLTLAFAVMVAPGQTFLPFLPYLLLSREGKRRFPVTLRRGGSPPLLGAAMLVLLAGAPVVCFAWFAATYAD